VTPQPASQPGDSVITDSTLQLHTDPNVTAKFPVYPLPSVAYKWP